MNKLTAHHFLYPLLGLCLLACGVWIAKQEIAQTRAEERSKAREDSIKQIEQQRQDFIAQLEAERKKPATVQTVTKFLPSPLAIGSEIKVEQLPDSPVPQLVVTGDAEKNLQAIQDMEIKHLECDKNLDACGKERDQWKLNSANWESAAKGGSKMHRFLKTLKIVGCAGGGAALGSLGKWKGAAIGGAAGAATCSIF
jgi:hypothetical protein